MKSEETLNGDLHACKSALEATHTRILNIDFSIEQPTLMPNMENDTLQYRPIISASRPFRSWTQKIIHSIGPPCKITFIPVSSIDFTTNYQQDKTSEIAGSIMVRHLEEEILHQDFRILKSLDFGSFGVVKLACHLPTNTQVAVKVLEKNPTAVADNTSEVEILQSLEHRNIVRFFHAIDTVNMTYVVMEYVPGKNLEMFLRKVAYLTEDEARPIFQQMVTAVHFLHQRLIAHRDIKLENILIDRAGNVKLCDFGLAIQLKEGQMLKKGCGSLHYMAPEILAGKPYDGLAVDMWSLGVVLYVLVTGQFPYEERTYHGMHKVISNTKYPLPYHLSKPCCQIIGRLLAVPTRHRITISQLRGKTMAGPH
ncbi:sperm motility kinase-like [Phodopus roborovskii]|uniref:sperm motility kinase-like n=1 Tax=Phodopus roborovskii TaxID=109678 RepID=UPI0021E3FACC|nr:sperm motility kinase-like [Phodopus roborovskii]